MRAAAILGLGCSPKQLAPFQANKEIEWRMGMPADRTEVDIVLLFGGDGTIHRHLGQLVKLGLPVLAVLGEAGDDSAHSLGLKRVRDSLAAWHQFSSGAQNVRAIDLGVITPIVSATETLQLRPKAGPHTLTSRVLRESGWTGKWRGARIKCRGG